MNRIMLAIAVGLVSTTAVTAQTAKQGIDAWQKGDHATAIAIWRNLAEKGDSDSAFNLGQAYRLGRGVPPDSAQAQTWFERAARAGHLDAQVSLGILLFDSGNRTGAMRWLRQAADRGEPRAMLIAGTALYNGDGVPRDVVRAYAYVSRAAAQGLEPAKTTLAEMDQVIPLAERQKGVALALDAARAPAPPPAKAAHSLARSARTPPPPAPSTTSTPASGDWRVQLGAFSSRASAEALFRKLAGNPALAGRQSHLIAVGSVTRLQVGPFESRAAATNACARLRPQPCFAVQAR